MKLFKRTSLVLGLIGLGMTFASAKDVTVFAAASLQNAIDEVTELYNKEVKESNIERLYDSSSNLARQIEQGAPADIFISANQNWMDYLEERSLVEKDTRANIVKNELAIITNKENDKTYEIKFDSNEYWAELLEDTRLAVGDPDHVPVGMYAKTAFNNLGVWKTVEPRVAAAQNVRAALLLVEVKEAEIGIVYSSDASVSEKVKTITTFPDELHDPIEYPIAIMKGRDNAESKSFYNYLLGEDAKEIFKKYGFAIPANE